MPEKLSTRHTEANAAIEQLREAAKVLAQLGERNMLRDEEISGLSTMLHGYEQEMAQMREREAAGTALFDAISDFERGVRDKAELLAVMREQRSVMHR